MQQQTQVHLFYTHNIVHVMCMCLRDCVHNLSRLPRMKKSQGTVWTQPLWPQSVLPSDLAAWEGWSQSSRPHSCWRRWIAVRSLGAIADLDLTSARVGVCWRYTDKRYGKSKTHPTFPGDVRISLGCHYDGAGLPNEGHTIEYRISASKPLNISRIAEKIHVQATLKVLLRSRVESFIQYTALVLHQLGLVSSPECLPCWLSSKCSAQVAAAFFHITCKMQRTWSVPSRGRTTCGNMAKTLEPWFETWLLDIN